MSPLWKVTKACEPAQDVGISFGSKMEWMRKNKLECKMTEK